jgi:hypothetical protein
VSLSNVLRLTSVYSKSSRLITRKNFRRYIENRLGTYAIYALAIVLGTIGGLLVGYLYMMAPGPDVQQILRQAILGFFVSLPTLSVLYTLFLTMMFQIQRSGARASIQPIYWFPVTWGEHTAASVLSSMLTGSLWIALLLCSAALAVSIPMGLLPIAVLTSLGLATCTVMTGVTMEVVKALLAGFAGTVLKAAGKSAIWVRFFATILVFTVAYAAYFAVTQSSMTVVFNAVSEGQLAVWFIPYVWPGIALYAFEAGVWLETALFFLGSIIFTAIIFALATGLNSRYGLSDTVAIRVSSTYESRPGLMGRLGVSPIESAIMKKDFKAFTRRSELMYVFIAPIVIVMATFMPLIIRGREASLSGMVGMQTFYYLYLAIFPSAMLALMLGTSMVGMEGERLWFLNASPVSIKSFVRAKLMFPAILCTALSLAFCAIGYVIFRPSLRLAATGAIEAALLVLTIGAIALSCGILGADFREAPRPRMIRMEWRLACMLFSAIAGLLILLPALAYGASAMLGQVFPSIGASGAYLYAAWILSSAIALALAYVSYRIAMKYAGNLLGAMD